VLDKELVRNRVFGALNVVYDPETSWSRITGLREQDSMLAVSAAVTTQISPGLFVGAEARYLRKYDGIGLDTLLGQALFVGPSTFFRLSKTLAISGAWGFQVAGHATGMPAALDLTNFTRQQATVRLEYNF